MTLRCKICLFAVKLFENHVVKVDRAEILSLSIYVFIKGILGRKMVSGMMVHPVRKVKSQFVS